MDDDCFVTISAHFTEIDGVHATLKNKEHERIVESVHIAKHFELWRLLALEKVFTQITSCGNYKAFHLNVGLTDFGRCIGVCS